MGQKIISPLHLNKVISDTNIILSLLKDKEESVKINLRKALTTGVATS